MFKNQTFRDPGKHKVQHALDDCADGKPGLALGLGRSLWYWGRESESQAAHDLLQAAYIELKRPLLAQIVDIHFQHRDLPHVDLLKWKKK